MMARRTVIGAGLVALGALFISGCKQYPKHVYRFKLTVEVETPEGLRSGYSVYEITANDRQKILPDEAARAWSTRGEAVAVDIAPGKTLFALLKTKAHHGDMASLSMQTLLPDWNYDVVGSAERIANRQGITSPAKVKPELYPIMVTFRDNNDPTSIEMVDPEKIEASFGVGANLKSITAEVTDEQVNLSIADKLSWFRTVQKDGGNFIPMEKFLTTDGFLRYRPAQGYDPKLAEIGLSYFSTESNK